MKNALVRDLNQALKIQLTLINELFIHGTMINKTGLNSISKPYTMMAITGGRIAEKLIACMVENGKTPEARNYDLLKIESSIDSQLSQDLDLYLKGLEISHGIYKKSHENAENSTTQLAKDLIKHFEFGVDFLSQQMDIIKSVGKDLYIDNMKTKEPGLN